MGVYYYFFNQRTEEKNMLSIPGFNLSWVAKLDSMDDIEEIFRSVIEINPTWLETDIIAYPGGPYKDVIIYHNYIVTFHEPEISSEEEDYEVAR